MAHYRDQDSQLTNEFYKQDQGMSRYNQDREWEDQDERLPRYTAPEPRGPEELFEIDNRAISLEQLRVIAESNIDRVLHYELALKELKYNDSYLKILFSLLADDGRQYIDELNEEIENAGGHAVSGSWSSGKVYRRWTNLQPLLQLNRAAVVMSACERAEEEVQKVYETALQTPHLTAEVRSLIADQKKSLEMSYRKITELQNLQSMRSSYTPERLRTSA